MKTRLFCIATVLLICLSVSISHATDIAEVDLSSFESLENFSVSYDADKNEAYISVKDTQMLFGDDGGVIMTDLRITIVDGGKLSVLFGLGFAISNSPISRINKVTLMAGSERYTFAGQGSEIVHIGCGHDGLEMVDMMTSTDGIIAITLSSSTDTALVQPTETQLSLVRELYDAFMASDLDVEESLEALDQLYPIIKN